MFVQGPAPYLEKSESENGSDDESTGDVLQVNFLIFIFQFLI